MAHRHALDDPKLISDHNCRATGLQTRLKATLHDDRTVVLATQSWLYEYSIT